MLNVLNRIETKLSTIYNNPRHVEEAADAIIMTGVRTNIDIEQMMTSIEDGTVFDHESFFAADSGNLFDFIDSTYAPAAARFIEITVGGNGGMASVGRGEFVLSFLSNFAALPSKSGRGDLDIGDHAEEIKFNGGKISVVERQGRDINTDMNRLLAENDFTITNFVPFRKRDRKSFTETQINQLNGLYYRAVTNDDAGPLTDDELKIKFAQIAFNNLFAKSNSILIMEEDGSFVRFTDADAAVAYHAENISDVGYELRASQSNPPSLYCHVL